MSDEICVTGKETFQTLREAITAANGARGRMGKNTRAYRCKECDLFHITSGKKLKYKGMRRAPPLSKKRKKWDID